MKLYVITSTIPSSDRNKRIGILHSVVFHGLVSYSGRESLPNLERFKWELPAIDNKNREPAHISRSGRFIPDVFGNWMGQLFVSEQVKNKCPDLPGIEFNPVEFELLVDLPMPAVGDLSWDHDLSTPYANPRSKISQGSDVPEFHEHTPKYYTLLTHGQETVRGFVDPISISVDRPSYLRIKPHLKSVTVSESFFEQYSALGTEATLVLRDDAFAWLAPFLNLDYYYIAVINTQPMSKLTIDQILGQPS